MFRFQYTILVSIVLGVTFDARFVVSEKEEAPVAAVDLDCDPLETKFWVSSAPYTAIKGLDDGTNVTLSNLTMNFTITDQVGCNFAGINSWTNGEIGGVEYVAGAIIVPPPSSAAGSDGIEFIVSEVGKHPEGGTSGSQIGGFISADGSAMTWFYIGRGGHADEDTGEYHTDYVTAFEAFLVPGNESLDGGDAGEGEGVECKDFSGSWISDPFSYYGIYNFHDDELSDDEEVEEYPNTNIVLELTQSGCFVTGTNSWANQNQSMVEYVVGTVNSKTSVLHLYEIAKENNVDGDIEISFSNKHGGEVGSDVEVLDMYFVGSGSDNNLNATRAVVFDAVLGRDAAPELLEEENQQHRCESDLIGVWEAMTESAGFIVVDENGDVSPGKTADKPSFEIVGQNENTGCEYWGFGSRGDPFLAQSIAVNEDDNEQAYQQITLLMTGLTSYGSTISKQYWYYVADSEAIVASSVGTKDDGGTGIAGSVVFRKVTNDSETEEEIDDSSSSFPRGRSHNAGLLIVVTIGMASSLIYVAAAHLLM